MRKIPFLFLVLVLVSCRAHFRKEEKHIMHVLHKQEEAWNRGDLEGFMQGYWRSDSLKFIGKSGITYGWEKTFSNYKKGYPDTATMGKLSFEILYTEVFSNHAAHVTGKWFLKRSKGDVGGYFTLVFRKIKGKWLIVSDHTS